MTTSVRIVKDNFRDVSIRIDRNVKGAVRKASLETEKQIKELITHPPGGASPTAQAADHGGLVDTGNYRDSWTARYDPGSAAGWYIWTVGSPVEYGPYLEYGTRRAPAYPHVLPAAERIRDALLGYFQRLDK